MGLVREPNGVDFYIHGKELSKKDEKTINDFISKRKIEIKQLTKKSSKTKHTT